VLAWVPADLADGVTEERRALNRRRRAIEAGATEMQTTLDDLLLQAETLTVDVARCELVLQALPRLS